MIQKFNKLKSKNLTAKFYQQDPMKIGQKI